MWDDYHLFLIESLVTTRLLLNEFYHLIDLPFWLIDDGMLVSVCLLDDLILDFCCSSLSVETNGFEVTSTITLVLQANRITTPKYWVVVHTKTFTAMNFFTRLHVLFHSSDSNKSHFLWVILYTYSMRATKQSKENCFFMMQLEFP